MSSYNLKFFYCYIDCNNFKEKELLIFRNIVSNARLGNDIKFSSYGTITFNHEDTKHEYPILTELSSFSRGKTNAIIFDMPVT